MTAMRVRAFYFIYGAMLFIVAWAIASANADIRFPVSGIEPPPVVDAARRQAYVAASLWWHGPAIIAAMMAPWLLGLPRAARLFGLVAMLAIVLAPGGPLIDHLSGGLTGSDGGAFATTVAFARRLLTPIQLSVHPFAIVALIWRLIHDDREPALTKARGWIKKLAKLNNA